MNAFALWVGIGAVLGLWRMAQNVPRQLAGAWLNFGLLVLGTALGGARVFYVIVHWHYFIHEPSEIARFWMGGLSWPGAVIGALLSVWIMFSFWRSPRGKRPPFGWIADQIYPLLPPLAIASWLGCWSVGAAYGPVAPADAWWGVPSLDESGFRNLHWPLQPVAAISLLIFFWLLESRLPASARPGRLSGLALFGLILHLLLSSLLRADPTLTWYGLRPETWMALAFLILLSLLWMYQIVKELFQHDPASSSPEL